MTVRENRGALYGYNLDIHPTARDKVARVAPEEENITWI